MASVHEKDIIVEAEGDDLIDMIGVSFLIGTSSELLQDHVLLQVLKLPL